MHQLPLITGLDIFWSIILLFVIYSYSKTITANKIVFFPYYAYYTKGLMIKLFGGILFCLIYALYYKGGDTVHYYEGVVAMNKVFWEYPMDYIQILFLDGMDTVTTFAFWKVKTYPPIFMLQDSRTFLVIKLTSILSIPSLNGFIATTILLAALVYNWIWKLYTFVAQRYPQHIKEANWSLLFLPSSVFWGSGIMKDTYTFAASCFAVYGLHQIVVERKFKLGTLFQLIFAIYLIITIKSYILLAILPGLLLFANFERIRKIQSPVVKIVVLPLFTIGIFLILNVIFSSGGDAFGKYSPDRALEEAAIQNQDLKRDVYGSNSFDIGDYEPTLGGALSKFFPAVNAAIFRPYLWEVGSPTMLFSALENAVINVLSIIVLITGLGRFLKFVGSDPFFLFGLLFTLLLGFGIGLSTANFGALVRYKIPFMPFYLFLILVARKSSKKKI
jgi:hypothetical protein